MQLAIRCVCWGARVRLATGWPPATDDTHLALQGHHVHACTALWRGAGAVCILRGPCAGLGVVPGLASALPPPPGGAVPDVEALAAGGTARSVVVRLLAGPVCAPGGLCGAPRCGAVPEGHRLRRRSCRIRRPGRAPLHGWWRGAAHRCPACRGRADGDARAPAAAAAGGVPRAGVPRAAAVCATQRHSR